MKIVLPPEKTYLPGARKCIYCWPSKDVTTKLGREHIIPDTLGGRLILHKAACSECEARINREIEIPTLKRMWIQARTHLGLKSSEPKQSLPIGTWTAETSEWPNIEEVNFAFEEIDLGRHPLRIVAPRFQPPGILWGRAPTEKFQIIGISAYAPTPDPPMPDGKRSAVFQPFSPDIICRSIAKIAHGAAVAELGFNKFEPMLPPIILGEDKNISHLIGSTTAKGRKRDTLHEIVLDLSGEYVIAKVQLFARYQIQPFLAVVGRARQELMQWHVGSSPDGVN